MYSNVKYLGATLEEWQRRLNNMFNAGEIYRMIQSGMKIQFIS